MRVEGRLSCRDCALETEHLMLERREGDVTAVAGCVMTGLVCMSRSMYARFSRGGWHPVDGSEWMINSLQLWSLRRAHITLIWMSTSVGAGAREDVGVAEPPLRNKACCGA